MASTIARRVDASRFVASAKALSNFQKARAPGGWPAYTEVEGDNSAFYFLELVRARCGQFPKAIVSDHVQWWLRLAKSSQFNIEADLYLSDDGFALPTELASTDFCEEFKKLVTTYYNNMDRLQEKLESQLTLTPLALRACLELAINSFDDDVIMSRFEDHDKLPLGRSTILNLDRFNWLEDKINDWIYQHPDYWDCRPGEAEFYAPWDDNEYRLRKVAYAWSDQIFRFVNLIRQHRGGSSIGWASTPDPHFPGPEKRESFSRSTGPAGTWQGALAMMEQFCNDYSPQTSAKAVATSIHKLIYEIGPTIMQGPEEVQHIHHVQDMPEEYVRFTNIEGHDYVPTTLQELWIEHNATKDGRLIMLHPPWHEPCPICNMDSLGFDSASRWPGWSAASCGCGFHTECIRLSLQEHPNCPRCGEECGKCPVPQFVKKRDSEEDT